MSRSARLLAIFVPLTLAAAGAAQAQPADPLRAAVFRAPLAEPKPATSSDIRVAYDQAPPERPEGVAKTAVDHAFDRKAVASVGFLCGLDERKDTGGAMGAYGSDPQGRFVGAKLHLAF